MSMDVAKKPNIPGLGGGFGARKSSSASKTVRSNLLSGSSATRTFTLSTQKRTGFVAGQGVSKGRYDSRGLQAQYNQRRTGGTYETRSGYDSYNMSGTPRINMNGMFGMGGMMGMGGMFDGTFMGTMNGIQQLASLGFQIADMAGLGGSQQVAQTGGSQLGSAMSNLGGTTGLSNSSSIATDNTASFISAMESCQDSASLRGAISAADSQLSALEQQTNGLKSASDASEKNLKGLETTVKQKEDGVSKAKQGLTNAKNTVTAKTNVRDTKKLALEKADANYAAKSEALSQAQANTASAQSALDSANAMPDQVPDGNGGMKPNEAKQQAVQQATEQLQQAKEAEQAAEKAKAEAKQQADAAGKDVEKAEKELQDAEKGVKDAEDKQKAAEENLKKAEGELEKAKQDVADAKGAIETFKQHEQDVKELTGKITKQKERLTKLENEEIKNYQKYDGKAQDGLNKANELAGKIDGEVDTRSERRASKGIDKANDKTATALNNRNALSSNVNDTNYIRNELLKGPATKIVNGENYYHGTTPSGQEVFYRGNELISKEDFENAGA